MAFFDVFNGDADGMCALHQLRLVEPRDTATLVTGVKRDIDLLTRVPSVHGARVTVLDVSLKRNRAALMRLLDAGMVVEYFDHHDAGDVPRHAGLQAHLSAKADVCTSLLVDRHLGGRHSPWAVVGAFGDNLDASARRLAASLGLPPAQVEALRELGDGLNYNAYGADEVDLFMPPEMLYRRMRQYPDPWRFIAQESILATIRDGRARDLEQARQVRPHVRCAGGVVYLLPDAPWSRRVRGAWANQLAQQAPGLAHALLTPDGSGGLVVSVRAPLHDVRGADRLCAAFPGGGGRPAAAGINRLESRQLAAFVSAFERVFGRGGQ